MPPVIDPSTKAIVPPPAGHPNGASEGAELLDGVRPAVDHRSLCVGQNGIHDVLHDGDEDGVLGWEVVVEGSDGDVGPRGDRADRRAAVPDLVESLQGSGQDALGARPGACASAG